MGDFFFFWKNMHTRFIVFVFLHVNVNLNQLDTPYQLGTPYQFYFGKYITKIVLI